MGALNPRLPGPVLRRGPATPRLDQKLSILMEQKEWDSGAADQNAVAVGLRSNALVRVGCVCVVFFGMF